MIAIKVDILIKREGGGGRGLTACSELLKSSRQGQVCAANQEIKLTREKTAAGQDRCLWGVTHLPLWLRVISQKAGRNNGPAIYDKVSQAKYVAPLQSRNLG